MTLARFDTSSLLALASSTGLMCINCCSGDDCDHCTSTPAVINVKLKNVATCDCLESEGMGYATDCGDPTPFPAWGTLSANVATDLEGDHVLLQSETNPCEWSTSIIGTYDVNIYSVSTCDSNLCYSTTNTIITITVRRVSGSLSMRIDLEGGDSWPLWNGQIALTSPTTCVDDSGVLTKTTCGVGPSPTSWYYWIEMDSFAIWSDCSGSAWTTPTSYVVSDRVENGGACYYCILDHMSSASDEPGTGANWETYWMVLS